MNELIKKSLNYIDVAVAVLRYDGLFLVAKRHAHQHQGGKLEFVGGKLERAETAKAAVIREVKEELGLAIENNLITKLGVITHRYEDKQVRLWVYQVLLDEAQYQAYRHQKQGMDNQALYWLDKATIVGLSAQFPSANAPILRWLALDEVVTISTALDKNSANHEVFVTRYAATALCYLRLPDTPVSLYAHILKRLIHQGSGRFIVPVGQYIKMMERGLLAQAELAQVAALHLPQQTVEHLDKTWQACIIESGKLVTASSHDKNSLNIINTLASQLPMWAVFVSPVLATNTHPDRLPLGWQGLQELAEISHLPVIALGGMSKSLLPRAQQHGAVAVAGIREFIR